MVNPKTKALQMPRVMQGPTEEINSFADCCRVDVGRIMKKVVTEQKKKVSRSKKTKTVQKDSLLEHVKLSVDQIREGAPAQTEKPKARSGPKQIKEKNMAGIFQNLIVSTIAKLNASFQKPIRP
jgi:hypothetical protein